PTFFYRCLAIFLSKLLFYPKNKVWCFQCFLFGEVKIFFFGCVCFVLRNIFIFNHSSQDNFLALLCQFWLTSKGRIFGGRGSKSCKKSRFCKIQIFYSFAKVQF